VRVGLCLFSRKAKFLGNAAKEGRVRDSSCSRYGTGSGCQHAPMKVGGVFKDSVRVATTSG